MVGCLLTKPSPHGTYVSTGSDATPPPLNTDSGRGGRRGRPNPLNIPGNNSQAARMLMQGLCTWLTYFLLTNTRCETGQFIGLRRVLEGLRHQGSKNLKSRKKARLGGEEGGGVVEGCASLFLFILAQQSCNYTAMRVLPHTEAKRLN